MSSSDEALYMPGDVVRTAFGVGVLIANSSARQDSTDGANQVRLWRTPGRSIASSSVAYLRSDAVSVVSYMSTCSMTVV